ncbi:ATP-binding protein [bacterium]|nr:ATP-binding protein [bacterium]
MLKIELPSEEEYHNAYCAFLNDILAKLQYEESLCDEIKFSLERRFFLSVPSRTSNLEILRQIILGIAANVAFSAQAVEDIGLAVDEACTNIINHSYGEEQEGMIDVTIDLAIDKLIITIIDTGERGQYFDPSKLEPFEKQRYLEQLERGGLGLYIIKTIMDEVEYNIQPGAYNRLKMIKYIEQK